MKFTPLFWRLKAEWRRRLKAQSALVLMEEATSRRRSRRRLRASSRRWSRRRSSSRASSLLADDTFEWHIMLDEEVPIVPVDELQVPVEQDVPMVTVDEVPERSSEESDSEYMSYEEYLRIYGAV